MTFIIGLAIKSLVVAGLTLALLKVFRNASAAQRSWLAHAGLGALLLLPIVATLMPALEIHTGLLGAQTPVSYDPVAVPATDQPVAHVAADGGSTVAADPFESALEQID